MRDVVFTERELDVMAVLWDHGAATVAEVRDRLTDELAYTTVLTILRTLEEKGYVGHRAQGRAYRYHPHVQRVEAQVSHLNRLTQKLFSGSTELLLTHLVAERDMSEEELERLKALLNHRLEG